MSDYNINKMDFKQLRNEVQLLRDELAIMQRKYEDILYNLDDDNFSGQFLKEKANMKTSIEQTEESITLQAEKVNDNSENIASLQITAEGIRSEVNEINGNLENYTTIEQTAEAIRSQAYASADLSSAIEISDISKATDQTKTYYIKDGNGDKTYYYYSNISGEWEEIVGGGIDTVFEQTAEGFKLKGNVKIDGSCILTDSLTFDSSDNPLQVEYSVDGTTDWHSGFDATNDKFMRLKIGARWSDAMKIVGSDGKDGENGVDGNNATVTKTDIFNMLTNHGENQGVFAAFVANNNQVYINAEYLNTKIAHVNHQLYIGETSDTSNEKQIIFNNSAKISVAKGGVSEDGIKISATALYLLLPNQVYLINPSNTHSFIALDEYVSQYSGNKAVFA
jgi:hypothetical protein